MDEKLKQLAEELKRCALLALDIEQDMLNAMPDQRNAPSPTDLRFKAMERCESFIVDAQRTLNGLLPLDN